MNAPEDQLAVFSEPRNCARSLGNGQCEATLPWLEASTGRRGNRTSLLLALAWYALAAIGTDSQAAPVPLRLEGTGDSASLVVGPLPVRGALFVWAAGDLGALATRPLLWLHTNAQAMSQVRLPLPTHASFASQGFFTASQWSNVAPVLVNLQGGTFVMGTPPSEPEQAAWEGPQTTVTLSGAWLTGQYEVTQGEYQAVMGSRPSYFSGDTNRPVEQVSWSNATNYCARLTQALRAAGCLPAGWAYRLPTEAEWEYACRAGAPAAFSHGPALRSGMANFDGRQEYDAAIGTVANPAGILLGRTTAVGEYAPNAWGMHDLQGNVWEWCQDWWGYRLPGGSVTDPRGPASGTQRVLRGGGWYSAARACRSAYRAPGTPEYRGNEAGFRVVLAPVWP
jgi:formylglycine-generating enzyme required for sulfatase activity